MGTDIHLFVERRTPDGWESLDTWIEGRRGYAYPSWDNRFYSDRNYDLFAVLADVRNSGGFKPISPSRGLPGDLSPNLRKYSQLGDNHNHSWLMLRELVEYDWDQRVFVVYSISGTLRDCCGDFIEKVIPRLQTLGGLDDIRIVFWFDS